MLVVTGNHSLRAGNPFLRVGRRPLRAFLPVNRDLELATCSQGMSSGPSAHSPALGLQETEVATKNDC